jgi:2-hydroxychromene-2-carboxylate isomerase
MHGAGVDSSCGNFLLCYRLRLGWRPVLVGGMYVVRGAVLLAAGIHVVFRVRNEFLAAALGAEIEVVPTVLGAVFSVLGDRHPTDDINHSIRTGLSMVVMRMCSGVRAMVLAIH